MTTGRLLRHYRQLHKYSQAYLADLLQTTTSVINELEKDRRPLSQKYFLAMQISAAFFESEIKHLREQAAIDEAKRKYQVDLTAPLEALLSGYDEWISSLRRDRINFGQNTSIDRSFPIIFRTLHGFREEYRTEQRSVDRLLGRLLVEKLDTLRQIAMTDDVIGKTRDLFVQLSEFSYALEHDPLERELATIMPVAVRYVANKVADSRELLSLAASVETPAPKVLMLRAAILNEAILADQGKMGVSKAESAFHRAEESALRAIADNKVDAFGMVSIYEALALAHTLLRIDGASAILSEAKLVMDSGYHPKSAFFIMQGLILRTQLFHLVRDTEADPNMIIEVGEKAFQLTKNHTMYNRQRRQIIDNLIKHNDQHVRTFGKHLISAS